MKTPGVYIVEKSEDTRRLHRREERLSKLGSRSRYRYPCFHRHHGEGTERS